MDEQLSAARNDVEPDEADGTDRDDSRRIEHKEPSKNGAVSGDFVFAVSSAEVRDRKLEVGSWKSKCVREGRGKREEGRGKRFTAEFAESTETETARRQVAE